jgi:glycosyltransferase involved in cell wall biosynthesis
VEPGTLRQLLNVHVDVPIVGFVGRLHAQKNPLRWLRAAESLAAADPSPTFVMIGDGPERDALRRAHSRSRHRSRIHLLGYHENIRELMRDFDVLLLTSRYEGVPLVAFEAMSLGIPVVSTDVGGTRECVGDGIGEILPAEATADELAEATERWLARRNDPLLQRACRDRIVGGFAVSSMQTRYTREFSELAGQCNRATRLREYQEYLLRNSLL